MSKKRLLATILWSATLAATGAIADVTHTPFEPAERAVAAQRDAEDAAFRRLLEQFRTIKISLSQAVAIAEHLHDGSRTAEVSFEISSPPVYRVRTVRNERVWENVIDANTGSVREKEISSSLKELDREDLGNIIALKSVQQDLSVLPLVLHDERYEQVERHADRNQIRKQLDLPRDAIVAISLAVVPKQKGADRTLAALAGFPDLHLVIAGSSDSWVKRQVRALKLEHRVRVIPYTSKVVELLSAADFLLHPARVEAAGQVIAEALLAGTPAIVSEICGYASEVKRSGAGIVLPEPFEQSALVSGMSNMIERLPLFRDAAAAESKVQQLHRGRWLCVIADEVENRLGSNCSRGE